jgi:D-alanyl-D-alanine carboxypeptidase
MTALVAVGALTPRERVRVSRRAAGIRGSAAGLPAGARVRTEALLHGLLLASGNDAATALAEGAAGSERAFVARMNRRARSWGLRCTRFVTPSGLGAGNRSCPADLAELARRALAEPRVARIVRRPAARVRAGRSTLALATTNPLLRARVPGTLGLKTGWTPAAGRCLVAVVRRDGRRYAAILLADPDPGRTAQALVRAAVRERG